MSSYQNASLPSTRPVANIYIDCQNVGSSTYEKIIAHLTVKEHYTVNRIFIYGNWTKLDSPEQSWRTAVKRLNIVTVERNVTSTVKDAADDMIKEDMFRHSNSSEETNADVDFVLVTSDKGFKETVETLQNVGRRMIGIGRYSQHYTIANPPIHVYYDHFIHISDLVGIDFIFNAYLATNRENIELTARLANTHAKHVENVRSLAEVNRSLRVNEWVSNIKHGKTIQERDTALQEKDRLVKLNQKYQSERDLANQEKDRLVKLNQTYQSERDVANQERDDAIKERNQALKEKDDAIKEKDDAIKRKIATNSKIAGILKDKNEAIRNKDEVLRNMEETLRNKDEVLRNMEETLRNKDEELRKMEETLRNKDEELRNKDEELRNKNKAKDEAHKNKAKDEAHKNKKTINDKDKHKAKRVFDEPPKRKMRTPKGTNINKEKRMTGWTKNQGKSFIF